MSDIKKYDCVALGSCTLDCIFKIDDIMRLDTIDRDNIEKKYVCVENSSKLNVENVSFYPGGSAANIACDLANIGLKTAYLGGLGKDNSADICMKDMGGHGVDLSGVKIYDDVGTATSVILVNSYYKDRSILAYKGANNQFSEADIPEDMIKNTACFAWSSLTSENGINAIRKCIKIAREGSNGSILIAAAPSISIIKKCPEETLELVKQSDIISLNDEEILALTGKVDVLDAMKELISWGLKKVNCTLGRLGQWLMDEKSLVKTLPPNIHLMDTTGAGDATMSGLIYGSLKNLSLEETAKISASLSAMEIEAVGVRVGLPKKFSVLQDFINNHEIRQQTINL